MYQTYWPRILVALTKLGTCRMSTLAATQRRHACAVECNDFIHYQHKHSRLLCNVASFNTYNSAGAGRWLLVVGC